jgi:hypothetical protein
VIEPALNAHLSALKAFEPAEDLKEKFEKEIELVNNVLKVEEERAQNIEDCSDYPEE